jgi:hypothetical protein
MEFQQGGGGGCGGGKARDKFSVYRNPSLARALASRSVRPSLPVLVLLALSPIASASSILVLSSWEGQLVKVAGRVGLSMAAAVLVFRLIEAALGLVALFTLPAFFRAVMLYNGKRALAKEDKVVLSERQLGLLGLKMTGSEAGGTSEKTKRPPKAKPSTPSEPIVPIRRSSFSYTPSRSLGQSRIGSSNLSPGGERLTTSVQISPSTPLQKPISSPSTPWSRKSSGSAKGIQTEAMLEQFLAGLDENIDTITDSASKIATPPATITSFGAASPVSVITSTTPSGAARSTPLRAVRMSPGSHQKYSTPPKKGEG